MSLKLPSLVCRNTVFDFYELFNLVAWRKGGDGYDKGVGLLSNMARTVFVGTAKKTARWLKD